MPPKPKFTKEEIVAAALELVAQRGADALTAKELGAALGSSARPIFTVFSSMKDVQEEVRAAAMARFERRAAQSIPGMPVFKQVGMQMVLFGAQEPKLYRLLFMQENHAAGFEGIFDRLGITAARCIDAIRRDYALNEQDAAALFKHLWIYTFGLGALCATGVCNFSEEEISKLLTQDFTAMMMLLRSGKDEE